MFFGHAIDLVAAAVFGPVVVVVGLVAIAVGLVANAVGLVTSTAPLVTLPSQPSSCGIAGTDCRTASLVL